MVITKELIKHINVKYYFVRSNIHSKIIQLSYTPSQQLIADILTKTLVSIQLYENLRNKMLNIVF